MPVFIPERQTKTTKPTVRLSEAELEQKITAKVKNFEERMSSGNFHGGGGCDNPVPNDGGDCPPC